MIPFVEPMDEWYTVATASRLLRRKPETVRNMLRDGRLTGGEHIAGSTRRTFWVSKASVDAVLAGRARSIDTNAEGSEQPFRYANLRLIAINETYERAVSELTEADELDAQATVHRSRAIKKINEANAAYREIIAQSHIPDVPPQS